MSTILEIHMQSRPGAGELCVACRRPASGHHGLPTYNGDIVSNAWPGDWAAQPCCAECYYRHERGELWTADHLYTGYLDRVRSFADGGGI